MDDLVNKSSSLNLLPYKLHLLIPGSAHYFIQKRVDGAIHVKGPL
jgi:hypothetical protein